MPLVVFLRNHADQEFGWHRAEERRARGCFPVPTPATRLENWERQLVGTKLCVCMCRRVGSLLTPGLGGDSLIVGWNPLCQLS